MWCVNAHICVGNILGGCKCKAVESSSLLYCVIEKDLVDEVTFEWIPEGSEQASHVAIGA